MELTQAIFTRCSCRSFTAEAVSEEQLKAVLAAANAAPVGMGAYGTVHLTVIRNKEFLAGLSAATREFMKRDGDPIYGAPVLVLVSAKPGMPPTIEFQNTGTIIENMMLTATDLGLGSVYLGSIQAVNNSFEVLYKLKLKDGFWPVAALAVGNAKEAAEEREIPVDKIYTNIIA